ncbi:ribosome biogenesis GTPase Der [Desulfolucanica intricata]|uniref:ribosome biogenesis GTPase Der n=1 Tax=Desulfolucanica intricata TaxID=1285191 RepID=UPI0008298B90|nr:ribosome biogenesis GTPase Der [Desulfolucanica intricata]
MPKPIVAVVGRPNVGKSTLFNRIVGARVAIVEDLPGITRDRLYQEAEWAGRNFILVDTGGLDFKDKDEIVSHVRRQAEIAIAEADLILFVVDARSGLVGTDEEVAEVLRRSEKPVLLIANKVENFSLENNPLYLEFYKLGLGEPIPISAAEGRNTGDMLDQMIELLPPDKEDDYDPDVIKIAVIGRPNVGKSSLVNSVLGQERVIVSDIPGTTRDAIDTPFVSANKHYVLIDTAGIRRKSRIHLATEKYSILRSLKAIDRADVALIVLNAEEGVTDQDKRIAGYAHEKGKASVIIVNKWDLIQKDEHTMDKYIKGIRDELSFITYAPVLFTSALTKKRVHRVLELVNYVSEQHAMRIATSDLNNLIREAVLYNPPPAPKGKRLKIYYATQKGVKPPFFILFVNDPELMHFSYLRYLENQLRSSYGLEGTPVQFKMRRRDKEG